jgi:hypothetical protein
MPNLEYSESISKCGYRKIHRLQLESCRCERNDLEKYHCKDCNFETDLGVILKQHLRKYHRKDTDCVQDQLRNDTVVKSYICQKCSFETYSVLLWTKHLGSLCFGTEQECDNVCTVSCNNEGWHRCERCSFKTKEATVLERHQIANHSLHEKERFRCFHCKYKGKKQKLSKETHKL